MTARRHIWARFLALPNDSRTKTLGIAFLVAIACAAAVSVTSVALKPRQMANIATAREARLAAMIETLPGLADVLRSTGAETLEAVIVDLTSGRIETGTDAAGYDYLSAQTDPALSTEISAEADIAAIGRRPALAPAYVVRGPEGIAIVVLPVYGTGYQSTIRAYLALSSDLRTIAGLSIYEQADTPGLGSRIADPAWLATWGGRQAVDAEGEVVITVVRGADAPFEVDALSGATRSSTGVANMVRFWLGPDGFGPFLSRLAEGEL